MPKVNFNPFKFEKSGDKLSGTFLGVVTQPWPAILVKDKKEVIHGVGINYALKEFFQDTELPTGTTLTITMTSQVKTDAGRTVNVFDFNVDEKTLPTKYDKAKLQPVILKPEKDGIDWDDLYARDSKQEGKTEDIPL